LADICFMENTLISLLQQLKPIAIEHQQQITDAFELKHFKEGEYLFRSGQVCRQMFFIEDGVLRIMAQNEKGNEITYFFLKAGQLCTILKSFNEGTVADESIQAACDTQVMTISKSKLEQLYAVIPYLRELMVQATQSTLLAKISTRNAYRGLDSAERYKLFMEQQGYIAQRVSLTDIASYLGITPQSLSRIRRNIK
jgi:CRP-like cAMP-binding protein